MAYRIIADHIRTLTIAITDGEVPGNIDRGYIVRKILRRSVRYANQKLGAKEGLLAKLVPKVVETLVSERFIDRSLKYYAAREGLDFRGKRGFWRF